MKTALWITVALLLWEGLGFLNPGSVLIPRPSGIAAYLYQNAGLMVRGAIATSHNALWGFFWGNAAAVVLAALAVAVPRSERALSALFAGVLPAACRNRPDPEGALRSG